MVKLCWSDCEPVESYLYARFLVELGVFSPFTLGVLMLGILMFTIFMTIDDVIELVVYGFGCTVVDFQSLFVTDKLYKKCLWIYLKCHFARVRIGNYEKFGGILLLSCFFFKVNLLQFFFFRKLSAPKVYKTGV